MVRFGLVIGALALAFAASASIASAQERVPVPGGVYTGALTDTTGACSGGGVPSVYLTISDYGYRIASFAVTQDYPLPEFSSYPNISVAADGSFSQDGFNGRFAGTGVSGFFRFDPVTGPGCAGLFTARLQPGDRAEQTFDGQVPLIDNCGGGTSSITRSADLLSIVHVSVDGFHAGDRVFSGSGTFPERTVPIDPETGSFDWVYFPGREPGQEIAVNGTFALSTRLDGLITVSPSTCGPASLTAYPPARPIQGRGGGLPGAGSGPAGRGREALASWWLLLGVSGAVAAGAAFAALRRGATQSRR